MGETFAGIASSGPLLLAVGVAALAGLVSFLSPCILPLVPGYLSYVTGLAGADLDDALNRPTGRRPGADRARRGRLHRRLHRRVHADAASSPRASGRALLVQRARSSSSSPAALIIVLGLAFLGLIPGLQREWRIHQLPAAGLVGAPVLGAVFALSWVPCIGPTLGAVLALATRGRARPAGRSTLTVAYCLGLGLPFLVFGLGFRKLHRAAQGGAAQQRVGHPRRRRRCSSWSGSP